MPTRFLPKRSPLADNILDARIRHIEDWLGTLGSSGVNPNVTTNAGSFGSNAAASAGQVVTASGGGSSGGGSGPALALAGDVTGPVRTNLVSYLQGTALNLGVPAQGDLISYSSLDTAYENTQLLKGAYTMTAAADAVTALSLGPHSTSQTAPLLFASDALGATLLSLRAQPNLVAGTPTLFVAGNEAGSPTLQVQGASSQTASLQEWRTSAGAVLAKMDASGALTAGQAFFSATNLNTVTITNTGIGGLFLVQAQAGIKRAVINLNNVFQWGTDLAFNGSLDFWMQNLATGNEFLYCDVNDRVTLGTATTLGGVVVGVSGGKASFYGGAPVLQPAGTTDVLASLVTLGLRAASSNPPLNLGTGTLTAGAATLQGDLTLATHNMITDAVTGTKIGTASSQLLGFYGATPVAQISGSTDVLAGLVTQGLRAASSNPPLNIGTGTLTAGAAIVSGTSFMVTLEVVQVIGNSSMLRLGYATANYGSDADKTLLPNQYNASFLLVTSGVPLTATRNLIYPVQQGGFVVVHNSTTGGQSIQVIGATGTGVAIANGKTAMVYCDGSNFLRATPDT